MNALLVTDVNQSFDATITWLQDLKFNCD